MSEGYLDTARSVIISSPAGSGKTEKLARRYISLLEGGAKVERILCITFTEKAAAEMKERILNILAREKPDLYRGLVPRTPLMRISTIHAFCLKVIKRFSVELGLDPSLGVMDEFAARDLWTESLYDGLTAERRQPGAFFDMIRDRGLRGWGTVKRRLDEIHEKTPYPEIFIREGGLDTLDADSDAHRLLKLYAACLERYRAKKREHHLLDFNDLELLAFEALSLGPEAHNILHAFDEHTDHLLVDEFQDTSTLQWLIIDKLTEEWRAGLGAKRESGNTPTIFLVGDEKQSIYLFRGANVSLFQKAKERLSAWLGQEYHFIEVKDNYRSLPAIINFTNALFEHLMPAALTDGWKTRYAPFEAARKEGDGLVELLLLEAKETTQDSRVQEARALAKLIRSLAGTHEVYDGGRKRHCTFEDMAILLKRRTHLGLFEAALRDEGVPFVVLKGIGFYDEPETAILREMVSFIVDPTDAHSLFCILRSPLFELDYKTLSGIFRGNAPPIGKLAASEQKRLRDIHAVLASWPLRGCPASLAYRLECILTSTGGWRHYHETQRQANIRKFIAMLEGMESEGLSDTEIRETLLRQRFARDEAKANINAEGMNAVRIMTVHAAKGLQFPMVFLPSLDEPLTARTGALVFDDTGGRLVMGYEEDTRLKNKNELFRLQRAKLEEEEKRLFYVAVTRARDYLCLIGSAKEHEPRTGRLAYFDGAFDVRGGGPEELPFSVIGMEDVERRSAAFVPDLGDSARFLDVPEYTEPIIHEPPLKVLNVTALNLHDESRRHGPRATLIGTVLHHLFEDLSEGRTTQGQIAEKAEQLLHEEAADFRSLLSEVIGHFEQLERQREIFDIIMPTAGVRSYTELPFEYEADGTLYRGRMDRLIIRDGLAHIYDYKTFPINKNEVPALKRHYAGQMDIYARAASALFGVPAKAYLVFTHMPLVVPMD